MMPPSIMHVRIAGASGRGFGLWLPLFLLWPVLLVLVIAALPFALLAEVILALAGIPMKIVGLLLWPMQALVACRGLSVDVQSKDAGKDARVKVDFF